MTRFAMAPEVSGRRGNPASLTDLDGNNVDAVCFE